MSMQFFTAADGARLAFDDFGAGLPVLCLAGLTRNRHDFDYMERHLKGVRLIRMDYRGRGNSDYTGAATYTVPQEGADALALLDHLGLARAAIIGTSRGGLIGMYLAATARDRLVGLCLNDVGPQLLVEGLRNIMDYVGVQPTVETLQDVADRLPRNLKGFANVPTSRWADEAVRHYVQLDGRVGLNYDPELRQGFLEAMKTPEATAWPLFDACAGMPLALIHGAGSDLLGDDAVAEMRRRRPDMIYGSVPDRGHVPFLDEPESLAVIRDWITACEAAYPQTA